jgi:DNA-binding MarR family transcriptional regulator
MVGAQLCRITTHIKDDGVTDDLDEQDYAALAGFRFELRRFLHFSEEAAADAGLTPQQHQALLAVRARGEEGMLVGDLAERLMLRPHSASELVKRLGEHGLVERRPGSADRRQVHIALTGRARDLLASLSASHKAELRRLRPLLQRLLGAL